MLAVEHLNGGGDGGMMNTFSSKALKGNGILGKKVEYVTGDTQTKSDAARASAKSMIEKDGAVMIWRRFVLGCGCCCAGSVSGSWRDFHGWPDPLQRHHRQGPQGQRFPSLLQRLHVRAALAPVLEKMYGKDRRAYHLTADYNWGWTAGVDCRGNRSQGLGNCQERHHSADNH